MCTSFPSHPDIVVSVTQAIFGVVVRLHGILSSIVSDWDAVFTSAFRQELFHLARVHLHMNTAYHPQLDGQLEVVNKVIAMHL